ncbi:MAG: pantoate--beta-alanine ligase [Planctomycetota bacterium]
MKIITKIKSLKKEIRQIKNRKLTIGFVPTMGALHKGHLSLTSQAKKDADIVIMSIFVNKLQFGHNEDFNRYPRDLDSDAELAQMMGVDIIFAPSMEEIYPPDFDIFIDMAQLTNKLCGESRPGHFRGVMTVVTKLFNLVEPDIAYFGQKDYQQALIIKKLVNDLNIDIRIKILPTIRELDGLAMSSRNQYLTDFQRISASCIYHALLKAKQLIIDGEDDCQKIYKMIRHIISKIPHSRIDYIKIVDPETLNTNKNIRRRRVVIMIAIHIDKTRLIDNIFVCK